MTSVEVNEAETGHVRYIDDDDNYQVGDRVSCYLECFDQQKRKFILRPPGQVPLVERLRRARARRTSGTPVERR